METPDKIFAFDHIDAMASADGFVAEPKRFERKFEVPEGEIGLASAILNSSPLHFREEYAARDVFSIYYDTPEMDNLRESIEGANKRLKIRLRWYLQDCIESAPHFEIKVKLSNITAKYIGPEDSRLRQRFHCLTKPDLDGLLRMQSEFVGHVCELRPIVQVSYRRRYFKSMNSDFRLTIDSELSGRCVFPDGSTGMKALSAPVEIIELKNPVIVANSWVDGRMYLPLRLTRLSKYEQICQLLNVG